jgi:hypothetical protein
MSKETLIFIFAILGGIASVFQILQFFGISMSSGVKEKSLSSKYSPKLRNAVVLAAFSIVLCLVGFYMIWDSNYKASHWGEGYVKDQVRGKTFRNEAVVLDGKSFDKCNFENVKLIYSGIAPFDFTNNNVYGYQLKVTSPAIGNLLLFLKEAKLLSEDLHLQDMKVAY